VARKELRSQEKILKEKSYESQTVCETHLRKVQDHQAQRPRHDHLRESEAQAKAGLIPQGTNLRGGWHERATRKPI
jgi:hypothetical protein